MHPPAAAAAVANRFCRSRRFRLLALASLALPAPATALPLGDLRFRHEHSIRDAEPIELSGTVTFADRARDLLVLQDGEAAMEIHGAGLSVAPGQAVTLRAPDYSDRLAALPRFPFSPDEVEELPRLDVPNSEHRFFIDRLRGNVVAPSDGDYTFWLASDDEGELWVSADGIPSHAHLAASVAEWTEPYEYSRYPSQRSTDLRLHAGQVCWIDVLHAQHQGRTQVSAAWSGPGFDRKVLVAAGAPFRREIWNRSAIGRLAELTHPSSSRAAIVVPGARLIRAVQTALPPPLPLAAAMAQSAAGVWCAAEGIVQDPAEADTPDSILLTAAEGTLCVRSSAPLPHPAGPFDHPRVRVRGIYRPLGGGPRPEIVAEIEVPDSTAVERLGTIVDWGDIPRLGANPADRESTGAWRRLEGMVTQRNSDGSFVVRDQGHFVASFSSDGRTWTDLGAPLELPMHASAFAGVAITSQNSDAAATVALESIAGLPEHLENQHVGTGRAITSVSLAPGRLVLSGNGGEIWNSTDDFQFLAAPRTGEARLVARLTRFVTPNAAAKAGLMIRESLSPQSAFVDLVLLNGGIRCEYRTKEQGSRAIVLAKLEDVRLPCWLKLERRFQDVLIRPAASQPAPAGGMIEVAGLLASEAGNLQLARAVLRPLGPDGAAEPPPPPIPPLVPVSRVAGIPNNLRPNTLRLRGAVTCSQVYSGKYYLALQDASGGLFISRVDDPQFCRPAVGQLAEAYCSPVFSNFPDDLSVSRLVVLGPSPLPRPIRHPAELLFPEQGSGFRTEIDGIVFGSREDGAALVRCGTGFIAVALAGRGADFWAGWIDRSIRAVGVLAYPQPNDPLLLVPNESGLVAVASPPAPASSSGPLSLAQILALDPARTPHRVHARGTVIFSDPQVIVLQDSTAGLALARPAAANAQVDDTVEVAGFPIREGRSVTLFAPEVHRVGRRTVPPQTTSIRELGDAISTARWVRVRGIVQQQWLSGLGQRLDLTDGPATITALLSARSGPMPTLPTGTRVELTAAFLPAETPGAASIPGAGATRTAPLLLLREPGNIAVLERPAWWRLRQAAEIISGLLVGVIVLGGWVHVLRRRVAQRTRQLEGAMARLKAETETSATLAERNRLAGEIHDSVEQGFTGLMLHLDAAAQLPSCSPEMKRNLGWARSMAAFSHAELRNAVRELYSPVLEEADLVGALERVVARLECAHPEITVRAEGAPRRLPRASEHHIIRIAQEAIANSIKHARAKTIQVRVTFTDEALELAVADDGQGFATSPSAAPASGHFGLRSMSSRAKKLRAQLTISSQAGIGSTVALRLVFDTAAPAHGKNSHPARR